MKLKKIMMVSVGAGLMLTHVACGQVRTKELANGAPQSETVKEQEIEINQITEDLITEGPDMMDEDIKGNPDEVIQSKYGDLMVSIQEGSISPNGLILVYSNSGEKEYHYGSYYYLEKKENDTWSKLPYVYEGEAEVGWTSEAYLVLKGQDSVCEVDWEWLYGELPSGEYRIVKDGNDFRGTGDYDSFFIGLDFKIK